MTRSQIGLAYQTDGSRTQGTCVLASLIIVQMLKAGFVPSMYRVGYFKDQSQTSWAILLINFEQLVKPSERTVFLTSFSMGSSIQQSTDLSKESTKGISVDFFSSGYLDVSVPLVRLLYLWIQYKIPRLS